MLKDLKKPVVKNRLLKPHLRESIKVAKDEVHLGYVFNDQPEAHGGYRYTVNSTVLDFIPYEKLDTK